MTTKPKQRRLGRGLEALLSATPEIEVVQTSASEPDSPRLNSSNNTIPAALQPPASATTMSLSDALQSGMNDEGDPNELLHQLSVYEIDDNPFQPRREFSEPEIASLSESLKEHDMLQPVLVRRVNDRYQLISGERRLRAAIQAGWATIPARIREADDRLVAELAIVENLQRKDLNPIEKALSFRRYIEEHNCRQEALASRLKIDRSTVANLMRLLDLPRVVQDALRTDLISAGHARALLPLGDEKLQIEYCNKIQKDVWSVRATERLVKEYLEQVGRGPKVSPQKKSKSEQIQSLENRFRMNLGTKVEIKQSSRGKGQIVVHFNNASEFERLQQLMADPNSK